MEKKYPLCEEVGLELSVDEHENEIVYADKVEALLRKGIRLYGDSDYFNKSLTEYQHCTHTKTGILIDYKEIKLKKVTRDELIKLCSSVLDETKEWEYVKQLVEDIKNRVEKEGVE